MSEEGEPYENTLSLEELRKEVRRQWDASAALVKALRDLPEVPNWRVLKLLSRAATFPDDGNIGKAMQREYGLDAIAPRVEYEMGAGLWKRIRDGLLPTPPDDLESAKAEFNTALPDWWYVVDEFETDYAVTIGSNADADDTHTYRVLKPASAAEALREATKQALATPAPTTR